jgi:hypothetical protein
VDFDQNFAVSTASAHWTSMYQNSLSLRTPQIQRRPDRRRARWTYRVRISCFIFRLWLKHPTAQEEGETFIVILARALMKFGSPSHRVESQLHAVSIVLGIDMEVIHLPKCTLLSFGRGKGSKSSTFTKVVKASDLVELGRLHELHCIYRRVVHRQQTAKQASKEVKALIKAKPIYGLVVRCLFGSLNTNNLQQTYPNRTCCSLRHNHRAHGFQRIGR